MAQFQNNLSEGSVAKKLILFSLPFLASNFIQSLYGVTGMLIVGNFCGPESMSAVNISSQVTFILIQIVIGLCVGGTVLIGQYIGAGDQENLKRVITTLITMLLVAAVAASLILLVFKGPVLRLLQTPPEAYVEADRYLTVNLCGTIFLFGYNAFSAILRGMGDSKRPFYYVLISCILSVALDLLFVVVFGWAAFGVALAAVIAQGVSVLLCVNYMRRNNFHFDFKLSSYKIHKDQLKLIFKFGMPTAIQNCVTTLSFMFVTAIVNVTGGVTASAAVGAAGKLNGFVFMPTMAMSSSISIMTAQNLGAGRLDRAVKACKVGMVFSVFVSYTLFALIQLFPAPIMSIFGNNPGVVENGVIYLRSFSYEYLTIPFIFSMNGLLIGGGHTLFMLFNSMCSAVLLRVPACYLMGIVMGWGLSGVGYGSPVASTGSLIVLIIFMLTGRWKQNLVTHRRRPVNPEPVLEEKTATL